jgi:multiple sugar transport system permease protein
MTASVTNAGQQAPPATPKRRERGNWTGKLVGLAVIVVFVAAILLPLVYMLTTSVKEPIEIRESGALLPTKGVYLINWVRAYSNEPLHMFLINSTIIAVTSTLIALVIAVPTTYAIVRFQVGGNLLPSLVLGGYVMPPIVVSIPFFMGIKMLGLPNTRAGMIIVHAMINTPVAIWLLDSFFRSVPRELEEAAWIDGYSRFDTLRRVVLPLVMPGLVATAVICLILSWNEFLFAVILTYSEQSQTFPVGISRYQGEHGLQFGEMSAAALTGIIPIYILVLIFQRYVVTGLTRGGVKG